jgi:hypothetical protein
VHRTFETVDASKPLDTAFSRQQHPDELLLVTGRDRLVGFGGLDEITNLLRIKRAIAHRPPHALRAEHGTGRRTGLPNALKSAVTSVSCNYPAKY